jgi:hypothetical protein
MKTITIPVATAADKGNGRQSKNGMFHNDDFAGVDTERGSGVATIACTEATRNASDLSQVSPSKSTAVTASTKTQTPTPATLDRTLVFTVLIALVGVGVSAAFLGLGIVGAKTDKRLQFKGQASERIKAVEIQWHQFDVAGLWVHEACRASADRNDNHFSRGICSRDEFFELYEYLYTTGLDFQAISWVPNVTHVDRASMEEESRNCKY